MKGATDMRKSNPIRLSGIAGLIITALCAANEEPLNLEETVLRVLELNHLIARERIDARIANTGIDAANGVFDPSLQFTTEAAGGARGDASAERHTAALTGRLPTGARYQLALETESETDDSSGALRTEAAAGLFLAQPLLRGFGGNANLAPIRIARRSAELAQWELAEIVQAIVAEAVLSYYELYYAGYREDVLRRSRDLAGKLAAQNRRRMELGVMASPDVVAAEAKLAARSADLLKAETETASAGRRLQQLLVDGSGMDRHSSADFVLSAPRLNPPPPTNWGRDLEIALNEWPDLRQQALRLEIALLRFAFARNQALPSVDLFAGIGLRSDGDRLTNVLAGLNDRAKSFATAGLAVNMPLPDRTARARAAAAAFEVQKARLDESAIRQNLRLTVEETNERLASQYRRIEQTRRARDLAAANLEAEERRLRVGASSTFVILRLQEDLAEAEGREIEAVADYQRSFVEYDVLVGRLLGKFGLEI